MGDQSDHNELNSGHHHHEDEDSGGWRSVIKKIITMGHSHDDDKLEGTFIENTEEGIKAVKISFLGLMVTALFQVIIVYYTGSIALLADTVHNFSDAFTSIPLWIAFKLSQREKSKKYSYGYGRAEDLAGLFIVVMIAASAGLVFWESFKRLVNPVPVRNLGTLAAAAVIGFAGNELVAQYRIKVGNEINSEALVADGLHSRTDGLTSLSILIGVAGAAFGYPIIDPIVGLIIGILILFILRDAAQSIFIRLLDGVDPDLLTNLEESILEFDEVQSVHDTRARFSGRYFYAQTHIVIDGSTTISESHLLVDNIEIKLHERFSNIGSITIHVDPANHD